MKKLLVSILLLSTFNLVFSQENKAEKPTDATMWSINHYYKVYQLARGLQDLEAAKDALLDILVETPKNDTLLFELAGLYYQMQNYPPAALTASEVLKNMKGNMAMLEVAAVSYENMNVKEEAVKYYEKIYLLTEDFGSLYKVALYQYDLERFGEALINLDILISKPEAESQKIQGLSTSKTQKEFSLKIILMNLKGMALSSQGKKEEAKKVFEEILKTAPDFASAKENLNALK